MENKNKEPIKFEDITDFEHGQNTNREDIEAMLNAPAHGEIVWISTEALRQIGYDPDAPLTVRIHEGNPPQRGIMSRYAEKIVNPKYYGRITVDGMEKSPTQIPEGQYTLDFKHPAIEVTAVDPNTGQVVTGKIVEYNTPDATGKSFAPGCMTGSIMPGVGSQSNATNKSE